MPAKKTKNTKVVSRSSVKSKKFSWKGIIVLVAVVMVGTVAVFAFAETPTTTGTAKPRDLASGIASFAQEKPVIIQKLNDGSVKTISQGRSIHVATNGVVYCTPEDSNNVTTVQISAQELTKTKNSIKSDKIETLAEDVSPDTTALVGSYRSVTVNNDGATRKQARIYRKELETPGFQKAVNTLETLCTKAVTPIPEKQVPSFAPATPTTSSKPNLVKKIAEVITPKVSAAPYSATLDPNSENLMRTKIDFVRQANGRSKLNRSPCLDNAAREWARFMAENNYLAHSNTVYVDIGVLPEKYCGKIYGTIGENVGRAGTVDSMFTAYMNSPGHAANILGAYSFMGLGTYQQNGTPNQFNAQVFMSCTSCGSAAQSSY